MQVEVITDSAGLSALKAEWEQLEQRDEHAQYYVSHRFVSAWWDSYSTQPGTELRVITVRNNGRLVGVAPLSIRTEARQHGDVRVMRFASHGDFQGVLLEADERPDTVLKTVMAAVEDQRDWDILALTNIAGPSPLTGYLLRSAYNASLSFHIENPYIDLRRYRDFDDLAARRLPSKVRKQRNKLYRERDLTFRVVTGNEGDIFERIAALHRLEKRHLVEQKARGERYSLFEDPLRAGHIRNVFTRTDDAVTFLYEDPAGEIVFYRTCFRDGRRLLSWNSAYHPDYEDYRLGKVIQFDILQHLFEDGSIDVFDFGAGRYPWKFEWTDDFTVTHRLNVRRPSAAPPAPAPRQESPTAGAGAPPRRSTREIAKAAGRRVGLGKAKRAASRARGALVARTRRPIVWYAPHPDDESIFMGGSIAQHGGRRRILVMLTQGGATGALDIVNAKLDNQLSREQLMAARLRELAAAVRRLGVPDEDFLVRDLPDGGLEEEAVLAVIREMAERFPNAEHRTMSYLDPHRDHATAGRALRAAHAEGVVKRAVFHLPVPLVDESWGTAVTLSDEAKESKRAALRQYERWNPANGRYAIGAHSVKTLIREQKQNPRERIHGPDYQP